MLNFYSWFIVQKLWNVSETKKVKSYLNVPEMFTVIAKFLKKKQRFKFF